MNNMAKMHPVKWLVVFSALVVSMSSTCLARYRNPYQLKTFEIKGSRYFSDYNSIVSRYLREKSPRRWTRACVVGLIIDGKKDTAWVIWRGGGRLIYWGGGGYDALNQSIRNLSLRDDLVATDAAIGTSTYLESRPWLAWLERKCATSGRVVTVN